MSVHLPPGAGRYPILIRIDVGHKGAMELILATFSAPWGRPVRLATAASAVILLTMVLAGLSTGPRHLLVWQLAMVGLPLLILLSALPFMVRGYVLTERHIAVRRLGWSTVLPLAGLIAVTGEPEGLSRLGAPVWKWRPVWDHWLVLESQIWPLSGLRHRPESGGASTLSGWQESNGDAKRCTAVHRASQDTGEDDRPPSESLTTRCPRAGAEDDRFLGLEIGCLASAILVTAPACP